MSIISYLSHFRFPMALCLALMCRAVASADDDLPGSGGAYSFLNITSSARAYGLGGLNISTIGTDLDMVGQNPALIGPELGSAASFNYSRYLGSNNFAGVRFGHRITDRSAYAVGLQYFGYGTFHGYDETGNPIGDFTAQDVMLSGTYTHDITDRLRGGVSLKAIYSGYETYSAFALATDLGINYYDDEHDLSLSAVITNLGGQLKRFTDSYDRLPWDIRLGWSQQFGSFPIRWSVTAWNLTRWHLPYLTVNTDTNETVRKDSFMSNLFRHLVFGAELVSSDRFYISLGYNYKERTDMAAYQRSFFSGFHIGAGISAGMFGVNVAFAQPHAGGTSLMLGISTDLSKFLH